MSRRRDNRGHAGVLRASAAALVVVVVVGVAVAALWTTGRLNSLICGGACGAEAVAAPVGLEDDPRLGSTTQASPVVGEVDPDAVESAVTDLLGDASLGDRVGLSVVDPATGEEVLRRGPDALVPASTTKVLTAAAALEAIGPERTFETTVVRDGETLVLVGGGDPYLVAARDDDSSFAERADLRTLARRTAEAVRAEGLEQVSLGYDVSLFTGRDVSSAWEDSYVPDQIVTPISPLWVNRGIRDGVRTREPARAAAERFADLLRDEGVDVEGRAEEVDAPGTAPLARVQGPTVEQTVEALLLSSNNEATEVLARHVAIAEGEEASFEGGAAAIRSVLTAADVPLSGLELNDGSGLSRANAVDPTTLAEVVAAAIRGDHWPELLPGLPVGGFLGSLDDRYDGSASAGAGVVRAKTGTLTGVHSIAGYVTDARGVPLAFALMVDDTEDINPFETQAALDDVAAALAACECG